LELGQDSEETWCIGVERTILGACEDVLHSIWMTPGAFHLN
jgi:hypothetical protein